jgi:hypothetical protein
MWRSPGFGVQCAALKLLLFGVQCAALILLLCRVVKEIVVEEVKRRMACKIAAEETEGTLMVEACCLMVKLDDNPVAKIGLNSR